MYTNFLKAESIEKRILSKSDLLDGHEEWRLATISKALFEIIEEGRAGREGEIWGKWTQQLSSSSFFFFCVDEVTR